VANIAPDAWRCSSDYSGSSASGAENLCCLLYRRHTIQLRSQINLRFGFALPNRRPGGPSVDDVYTAENVFVYGCSLETQSASAGRFSYAAVGKLITNGNGLLDPSGAQRGQ